MPWKRPIFWPNCSRSAAWRTARSSARSARPRQVAATWRRVLPSQVPARSKPLPSSPSSASSGHPAVVEVEDRVGVAAVRHVAVAVVDRQARGVEVDEERRHRLRAVVGASSVWANRITKSDSWAWLMKCLVPRDPPALAVAASRTACVRMPRRSEPAPGSVMRQAVATLTAHARVEVALLLGLGAGEQDVGRPADGGVQRVAGPAELLLVEHPGHRVEAGSADLLGHVGGVAGRP